MQSSQLIIETKNPTNIAETITGHLPLIINTMMETIGLRQEKSKQSRRLIEKMVPAITRVWIWEVTVTMNTDGSGQMANFQHGKRLTLLGFPTEEKQSSDATVMSVLRYMCEG